MERYERMGKVVTVLILLLCCLRPAAAAQPQGAPSSAPAPTQVAAAAPITVTQTAAPKTLATNRQQANAGLASGQGTTMMVSWPENTKYKTAVGFNVYRSTTPSFSAVQGASATPSTKSLNVIPLRDARYEDKGLKNGTYWYKVTLIIETTDDPDYEILWQPPFSGSISGQAATKNWELYK